MNAEGIYAVAYCMIPSKVTTTRVWLCILATLPTMPLNTPWTIRTLPPLRKWHSAAVTEYTLGVSI